MSRCKSIRRDQIEREFEALLASVQPSATLVELAKAMFRRAWDQQGERARQLKQTLRRRIAEIEEQSTSLLDRFVEASSPAVVGAYELPWGPMKSALPSWSTSAS